MQCDLIHYDVAWVTYLTTTVVSAYGTGLFLWWMALNRFRTSSVFAYTMLWIFGTFFSSVIALYGRTLVLADPHLFAKFSQTIWWQLRTWVILLVLIALCIHMSIRAVSWARGRGTGVQYGRRTTDSDDT